MPVEAQPEEVVLMVSPCRSGSTAMLRVFGYSGYLAVFQPIKNALRWQNLGEMRPWSLPDSKRLFLKETFGPYHGFEVSFDPLDALLSAGMSQKALRLVVLIRDPAAVWASWQTVWSGRTHLDTVRGAFAACARSLALAEALDIPTRTLAYEDCLADPNREFTALFEWLGRELPPDALSGWNDKPGFAQPGSGVLIPEEPSQYMAPQAHAPTIASTEFGAQSNKAVITSMHRSDVLGTDLPALHAGLTNKARLLSA